MEPDNLVRYKLILFGDEKVGKTSLVERYVNDKFELNYLSTLGYNVYEKRIPCGDFIVSLMIYDIGGQERFAELRKRYAEGANTALLVFDVTNEESFDHIKKWTLELKRYIGNLPFILIGNKIDLEEERIIEIDLANKLSIDLGAITYIETSAKSGENVQITFERLAYETLKENLPK
ncbi:MAG: GTP-binding protein [Candidatus Lokiarchaeota archaeon]|nr:GTP-binding protein [Candidatus Lokiarchaeota archaeon]